MTRENSNTVLRDSHGGTTAILREFFRRAKENRKEKIWSDHAACVINIYSRFLKTD